MTALRQLLPAPAVPLDGAQLEEHLRRLGRTACVPPFAPEVVGFFSELSRRLFQSEAARAWPEIQALAFFLRKASLQRLQAEFRAKPGARAPRGTVFHVPPGNVETLFCFGFALAALAGNRNLVRLSPRRSAVSDVLVSVLNEALATDTTGLRERTLMLEYEHESELTLALSMACDVRVLWGGDETVRTLRQVPLPPRTIELTFPDRLSYAAFAAERLLSANDAELANVGEQLFNDAYWFDQRACSSPRALLLCGAPEHAELAAERLLAALSSVVERRAYRTSTDAALAKRLYAERLSVDGAVTRVLWPGNEVVGLSVQSLAALRQLEHCGRGLFLLVPLRRLAELAELVQPSDQTLAHYGFGAAELAELADRVQGRGLDRIVPLGRALELSHLWDGYDLLESFTRVRDVRTDHAPRAELAAPARS